MKNVKRFLALVLAVLLAFGNLITAVSAEEEPAAVAEETVESGNLESESENNIIPEEPQEEPEPEAVPPAEEELPAEEPVEEPLPEDEELPAGEEPIAEDVNAIEYANSIAANAGESYTKFQLTDGGLTEGVNIRYYVDTVQDAWVENNYNNASNKGTLSLATDGTKEITVTGSSNVFHFAVMVPTGAQGTFNWKHSGDANWANGQYDTNPPDGALQSGRFTVNQNVNQTIVMQFTAAQTSESGEGQNTPEETEPPQTYTVVELKYRCEYCNTSGITISGNPDSSANHDGYADGASYNITAGSLDLKDGVKYIPERATYSGTINGANATEENTYHADQNDNSIPDCQELAYATVSVENPNDVVYNGHDQKPLVTVTLKNGTVIDAGSYTVTYSNNHFAGTAGVTVTGKEGTEYAGQIANGSFIIKKCPLNISGSKSVTYTGKAQTIYLKDVEDMTVAGNCDDAYQPFNEYYDNAYVTVTNPSDSGIYTLESITGADKITINENYAIASVSLTVTVTPKDITPTADEESDSSFTVTMGEGPFVYDGTEKKPAVTVKDGDNVLTEDTDYTVKYADNVNAGTATVTVTGKGNYTGTRTAEFTIEKADLSVTATGGGTYTGQLYDVTITNTEGLAAGQTVSLQDEGGVMAGVNVADSNTWDALPEGAALAITGADEAEISLDNYNISFSASLSITAAPVVITVDNKTKTYNSPDPALTAAVTCDGVTAASEAVEGQKNTYSAALYTVGGESETTDTLTYTLAREDGESVAAYPIGVQSCSVNGVEYTAGEEGVFSAGNYEITVKPGSLTVTPASRSGLTVENVSAVYDGQPHALAVKGSMEGDKIYYRTASGAEAGDVSGWTEGMPPEATDVSAASYDIRIINENCKYTENGEEKTLDLVISGVTLEVTKRPLTIAIDAIEDALYYDADSSVYVTGTISGHYMDKEELTVAEFGQNGNEIQLVAEETIAVTPKELKNAGTYSKEELVDINWGAAKAENYDLTITAEPVTINQAAVTVTAPGNVTYNGETQELKPTVKAGETTLTEGTDYTLTYSSDTVNAGTVNVQISLKDTANYTPAQSTVSYEIQKRALTITTKGASKVYDGMPLTKEEGSIEGLVEGETASLTYTGSQTEAGSSDNTADIQWNGTAKKDNYTYAKPGDADYLTANSFGTLTVTARSLSDKDVKITFPSDVIYNGAEQKRDAAVLDTGIHEGAGYKSLTEGTDYEVSYRYAGSAGDNSFKDVGTVEMTVTGTGNYSGEVTGSYKILPFNIYITTKGAEFVYDGSAHPANDDERELLSGAVTYKADGSAIGEGETADVRETLPYGGTVVLELKTGDKMTVESESKTRTYVSGSFTQDNSATYRGTVTDTNTNGVQNFAIHTAWGQITVTKAELKPTVTIEGWTYDGTNHAVYGDEKVAITSNAVGTTPNPSSVTYYKQLDNGDWTVMADTDAPVDVGAYKAKFTWKTTSYEDAAAESKPFIISPAPVTVTAKDSGKQYGASDPALTATVEGTIGEDTVEYTVTRAEGENVGTYTITPAGAEEQGNYTVTYETGAFTITKAVLGEHDPLRVQVYSNRKTYDGNAHTVIVLDKTGLDNTFTFSTDGGKTWSTEADAGITNVTGGAVEMQVKVTNANYEDYIIEGRTVTIEPAPVTVTADNASKVFGDVDPALTATVEGTIGEDTVEYTVTRAGGEDVGTYMITPAGAEEQGNYTVTYKTGTFTITPAERPDLIPIAYNEVYDGSEHNGVSVSGTVKDDVITYSTDDGATWSETVPQVKNAGETPIQVKITNANYVDANGSHDIIYTVTARVTPAPLTIITNTDSKQYDGTPLTGVVTTVDGLVDGETLIVTASSITEPGTIENKYTIDWENSTASKDNYTVTDDIGTLTVTAIPFGEGGGENQGNIKVNVPADVEYDGGEHMWAPTVTDESGKPLDETDYTVAYSTDDFTNAGTITVTIKGAGHYNDADYQAITRQYRITPVELYVRTSGATRPYNGAALTAGGSVSGTVKGQNVTFATESGVITLVNGETATFAVTGSQTVAGTSDNTYTLTWGTAKESNYRVIANLGTLTVTARDMEAGTTGETPAITVSDPTNFVYDGAAHQWAPIVTDTYRGVTLVRDTDYTVSYSAGSFTNAGTVTVTIEGIEPNYTGSVVKTYRITPAALTVTTDSATKVFDGTALTAGGRVSGLVNGETLTLNVTGSQTAVGSSRNTYSISWNGTARYGNYTVQAGSIGTLTVTAAAGPTDGTPGDEPTGGEGEPLTTLSEDETPLGNTPESDYSLTEEEGTVSLSEDETPLAGSPLGEDADCILHLLLLLVALTVELYLTHSRKKHQKEEFELRSEINTH